MGSTTVNQEAIFWPIIALVALTFAVAPQILIRRVKAAFEGTVGPKDFRGGESARVPADVAIPNRNYMNLLELPILFYLVCVCLFVTKHVTPVDVGLAWVFTGLRLIHSIVHLTYNNVLQRLIIFNLGAFVLIALWIRFALALA